MSVKVGVVGFGYWGPNLARNFAALPGCELAWCCDGSEAARARFAPLYPGARFTGELDDLLSEVADMYEREVDYDIKNLSANIEPIITIALGVLVLILALGVFLPMWDMGRVMLKR